MPTIQRAEPQCCSSGVSVAPAAVTLDSSWLVAAGDAQLSDTALRTSLRPMICQFVVEEVAKSETVIEVASLPWQA